MLDQVGNLKACWRNVKRGSTVSMVNTDQIIVDAEYNIKFTKGTGKRPVREDVVAEIAEWGLGDDAGRVTELVCTNLGIDF
jgi:hypothetical protein